MLAFCKPCIRFLWSLYWFKPKSSHLSNGMLGLPSWCLDHSFPSGARICIAYHISHIMPCFASCCLCIAPWLIVGPLLVFLPWVDVTSQIFNLECYTLDHQCISYFIAFLFDPRNSTQLKDPRRVLGISLFSYLSFRKFLKIGSFDFIYVIFNYFYYKNKREGIKWLFKNKEIFMI